MANEEIQKKKYLLLVRGLAIVAAINCAIIPVFFAQQRPLFPFPGLYLIEIDVLGILGLSGLLLVEADLAFWRAMPWISAGFLMGFVILGGFSIGFFLIPATVAFLIAGFLLSGINRGSLSKHIGLFLVAAILQVTLMLVLVEIA